MLLLYLQDYDSGELERLAELCRSCLVFEWESRVASCAITPLKLMEQVRREDFPALFLMDGDPREELSDAVAQLRQWNPLHYLVLLLQTAQDALRLRPPFYRPNGFLLRPVEKDALFRLLESVYDDFSAAAAQRGEVFHAKVRSTVYPIPYQKILYFESRGKKIVAHTAAQEYEFYGSLEDISQGSPDAFQRVHKSFCVNLEVVVAANLTERTITLSDESILPFSRSYKQKLTHWLGSGRKIHSQGGG